ncbi:UNVERIFIED_CONTAM: TetR family transcriptional regulator [Microbacterium sp. SLM126]
MARLTREDWIAAAYERFSADGITAVAVEPVARAVGATKGSFYWHFADRRALVDAVLERWRELETEHLIAEVERIEPASARLGGLLELIAHRTGQRSGERTLYADATGPVRDFVSAVTERRVAYLASLVQASGVVPDEARRRAVIIVSAVIGYQQLVSSGWDAASDPRSLVDTLHALATGNTAPVA